MHVVAEGYGANGSTDKQKWTICSGMTLSHPFFSPEKDASRVFLYVTPELIQQLGTECLDPLHDFISAAMISPPWVTPTKGFCQKALQTFEGWRDRGLDYPPYITSLAWFVLAAGCEGEFASHAYYPRLWVSSQS